MSPAADTHVSVYITFPVPENVDFKSSIPKFYDITKKSNKELIYYAYAENGSNLMVQVFNILPLRRVGLVFIQASYSWPICQILLGSNLLLEILIFFEFMVQNLNQEYTTSEKKVIYIRRKAIKAQKHIWTILERLTKNLMLW